MALHLLYRATMSLLFESFQSPQSTLWEDDPVLLSSLDRIVADAAGIGVGARRVVQFGDDEPRALISITSGPLPWRAAATTVLTSGNEYAQAGTVGAPFDGVPGMRGAFLLYLTREYTPGAGNQLAQVYAARVEAMLASASVQRAATDGAIDALLQALAGHDPETARHTYAVQRIVRALGRALALTPQRLLEVERIAFLHDIGKIAVPQTLLHKVEPLDPIEWALIRQHPSSSERIVRAVPTLQEVSLGVRHHHERWDGTGYPDRLSGDASPFSSRLIAFADAYETMRAGRPYRRPLERDEAIRELQDGAGTQFDPSLVTLLPVLSEWDISFT